MTAADSAEHRFDETWYLDTYPDVAKAVEDGAFSSGFDHYLAFGRREGRRRSAADYGVGTDNPAVALEDPGVRPTESRRQRISRVWSVDAEHRAEVCGWYWMAHPMVVARINTMISGDPSCDAYAQLQRLLADRGWRLPIGRAVSLGCGSGNLERDLVKRGMVGTMDAYDLAEGAIGRARRLACEAGMDSIRYHVADLEALTWPERSLDAVFAHQSVHHVEKLEVLCGSIRSALKPAGFYTNLSARTDSNGRTCSSRRSTTSSTRCRRTCGACRMGDKSRRCSGPHWRR